MDGTPPERLIERNSPQATQAELDGFYRHLERELDASGFLRVPEKRLTMLRNIRAIFSRNNLSAQKLQTLHGIVKELRWGRCRKESHAISRLDEGYDERAGRQIIVKPYHCGIYTLHLIVTALIGQRRALLHW